MIGIFSSQHVKHIPVVVLVVHKNIIKYEKEYLNITKKVKPNHELLNLYGVILFQLNKYDQAIVQLKKSIEINPNYYQGYNSLGNIFFKKNDFNAALEAYQKAIDIKFDYHETYHNKGNVYLKLRQIDKALENYNLSTKFNSRYLPAIKSKIMYKILIPVEAKVIREKYSNS
mgnify:CR=1 FL=1